LTGTAPGPEAEKLLYAKRKKVRVLSDSGKRVAFVMPKIGR
jgi:hypothetical protein